MKKTLFLAVAALTSLACSTHREITVAVTNPTTLERSDEMVELSMHDIATRLVLADTAQIIVLNEDNEQVPVQVTYDDKLMFPVHVAAGGKATYTITTGIPVPMPTIACGRFYPERKDDLAWENDLIAFRAYGPALQASGERAFGYDVWTKYNTTQPVVEARYADELERGISYHKDHGNGLDCYKVGPTLGGGTAALLDDGNIVYPYCFKTYEILDNGPLRFTVKLTYHPLVVQKDSAVIETRLISLDVGSHLNKTVVTYSNLSETTPIAAGIVLHEPDGNITADADNGYMTYSDPTDNVNNDNGRIFVGIACPDQVNEARTVLFGKQERNARGADGHLLAIGNYQPGTAYTYYWGAAWSKADIPDMAAWNQYMADFAQKVRHPLAVEVLLPIN
ncbi:MAG: DUF4861 domain-containing protein [Prevotellaceae bacterium]|nr:DUF4861 domain-containing protein [Prevotellaceae bacterium]